MKAKLKNIFGRGALGVALLTTTVPTWAGQVSTGGEVSTYTSADHSSAGGTMVGARYSADNQQYIGCLAIASDTITTNFIQCHARDKSNKSLVCGSSDPKLLETLQTMTDSSDIFFEVDRNKGEACSRIDMIHSSDLLK